MTVPLLSIAGAAPSLVVYTPNDTVFLSQVELPGEVGALDRRVGSGARVVCSVTGRGSTLVTLSTWPSADSELPRRVRCPDGPFVRIEERVDARLAEAFARAGAQPPAPLRDQGEAEAAESRPLGCARARDWLGERLETLDARAVLVWIRASGCSPSPHAPTRPGLDAWVGRHPDDPAIPVLTAWSAMSDSVPWHRGVDVVFKDPWCPHVPDALRATLPPDGGSRWLALDTLVEMEGICGMDPSAHRHELEELGRSGAAGDLALALSGLTDGVDVRVAEAAERHADSSPLAIEDLRPLLLPGVYGAALPQLHDRIRERLADMALSDDGERVWAAFSLGTALGERHDDWLLRALELDPTNEVAWWQALDGTVDLPSTSRP